MVRSILATLVGAIFGGLLGLAIVVSILELLHTKNELVGVAVFIFGSVVGCYTAIRCRRFMLSIAS